MFNLSWTLWYVQENWRVENWRERRLKKTFTYEIWLHLRRWQHPIKTASRNCTHQKFICRIHNNFSACIITHWRKKHGWFRNYILMLQEVTCLCMHILINYAHHEHSRFSHKQKHLQYGNKNMFLHNMHGQQTPYQLGLCYFSTWILAQQLSCQELPDHLWTSHKEHVKREKLKKLTLLDVWISSRQKMRTQISIYSLDITV